MILALLVGALLGRMLRLTGKEILTGSIVFAVRNVSLALAIAVTLLNRVEYAVFAVVYFLTEVPLLLAFVWAARRWQDRKAAEHARPRPNGATISQDS